MIEQKEKEEISFLIKDLSEKHQKKKKSSKNMKFSNGTNRDIFNEKIRLDYIFTEKRPKSMIKKAWGRVQGFWNGK